MLNLWHRMIYYASYRRINGCLLHLCYGGLSHDNWRAFCARCVRKRSSHKARLRKERACFAATSRVSKTDTQFRLSRPGEVRPCPRSPDVRTFLRWRKAAQAAEFPETQSPSRHGHGVVRVKMHACLLSSADYSAAWIAVALGMVLFMAQKMARRKAV